MNLKESKKGYMGGFEDPASKQGWNTQEAEAGRL